MGKGSDRGAVLQTAAGVPITRASVTSGYTGEFFLKVPEPYLMEPCALLERYCVALAVSGVRVPTTP